jgi:5'-nucleotidase
MKLNSPFRRTGLPTVLASLLLAASPGAWALEIAVTNDDGWDSIGIQAVKQALVAAGHTVTLVAPLDGQSGSSAAVNLSGLRITKQREDGGVPEFSVAVGNGAEGAEPATSALVAINIAQQRTGRLPDLLVSGINDGANIGAFTQISGTVGAAVVALSSAFNAAVPAIAISTDAVCEEATVECAAANEAHFAQVADFLTEVIAHLESKPGILAREPGLLPAGVGLNINYPPVAVPAGVALSDQGRTASISGATLTIGIGCYGPCAALPVGGSLPGGITGVSPDNTPERRGADTTAFQQGYITIVPITPDYTAAPSARFNSVFKTLRF